MSESGKSTAIGVDGGGTRCRLALQRGEARVEIETGAANVATDFKAAIETLAGGLQKLAGAAGLSMEAIAQYPAHLGLAGVMSAEDADAVARALPFTCVTVTDDQPTSVAGALGKRDGAVAAIGTGSFVAGMNKGELRRVGGWGFLLGDEASGAWLGRRLLSSTLQVADGILAPSILSRATADEFGGAAGIVRFARTATAADCADLAPRIVKAATEVGDRIAVNLMQAGAAYIERALRALDWQSETPLCLIGGLGPHYAGFLSEHVRSSLEAPRGTALDGALYLADQCRRVSS